MKKSVAITLGVVIVGAGSWVGATWYTGKRIEESSQRRLAEVNEKLAKVTPLFGLRIDQIKYERGLFSTQARYGLSLLKNDKSLDVLPDGMIEFDATIEHGPFPKGALARGALAPKLAYVQAAMAKTDLVKPVFELTKDVAPLTADAIVAYGGHGASTAQIAPVKFSRDGIDLDFSGMKIDGTYDHAKQAVVARGVIDTIGVDGLKAQRERDKFKMALSGLSIDVNTLMGKFGLSIGDSGVQVKHIDMVKPQDELKIALDDFGYTVKLTEDDKNIAMQAAYKLGGLTVDGVALGSGQAVVKLGNLDGVAVKQLADTYNQMMRQAVAGASDEGLKDEQVQTLIDTATKLLAAKPTFSMDPISWKTAKGESKLTFALDLASPANLKDLTPQEILVQAIKRIDANLVVSKPMVQDLVAQYMVKTEGKAADKAATEAEEQVRSMAGMAEMFNVGKNDGDNIIGKFHFSDGMGDLNGKKIPADELFSGLLDAAGSHDSMDDDESEPAVGAISSDTDPASSGEQMQDFNVDVVTSMLDDMGYSPRRSEGDEGPVLVLDPSGTGAADLRVELLCNDFTEKCYDLVITATYSAKKPVSLKAINAWNKEYRWSRAYLDEKNQAVLQMDVNAEGAIGKENLQILLNTFISIAEDFSAMVSKGAGK